MRSVFITACVLVELASVGQNLVPNGDFEQYDTCPDFWNQLDRAIGWSSAGLSPDYYNACDTNGYVSVPQNVTGFQQAASGSAYAGGYTWCEFPLNRRELLRVQLTGPLTPGVPVYLSMKVAAATDGFQENMQWTVAGVGMRFSMTPFWYDQIGSLPDQAAISMSIAPSDTSIWYLVSGSYTPDSAYEHLAVGNFFSDGSALPQVLNPAGTHPCAYVYVDDVCVSFDPSYCDMASSVAHDQISFMADLALAPNPARGWCMVTWTPAQSSVQRLLMYDAFGRQVASWDQRPQAHQFEFDTRLFPPGAYLVHLESSAGRATCRLLITQEASP